MDTKHWLASLLLTVSLPTLGGAVARAEPDNSHTVRKGETLSSIARRQGCTIKDLKRENKLRGDLVRPGQTLQIPSTCSAYVDPTPVAVTTKTKGKKPKRYTHTVIEGESLERIALRYAMPMERLQQLNAHKIKRGLKPGMQLTVEASDAGMTQYKLRYTIQGGDTLSKIARRFDLSVKDIMRMNPGKKPDKLRIGDQITIYREGKYAQSQSIGRPQQGGLMNGIQLKEQPGVYLRRPHLTWGTTELVFLLTNAVNEVRRKHPNAHDLVIGDLSRQHGGFLAPHRSHQSGLDADIGFYFKGQPSKGPQSFPSAAHVALDYEATWTLLDVLIGKSEEHSPVEYMFIGYAVQEKLYKWAKANGISESRLSWMFQYPRGSRSMTGIIRHEPGHDNHIHLRIRCPSTTCHN